MSTERNLRPAGHAQQVPMTGAAELVLVRLEERRQELASHSPAGMSLAAAVLAAMGRTANGHTPDIRCDRQVRYRLLQFDGSKPLPVEDLAAIALEGDLGHTVAVAGLRVLAEACGFALTPIDAREADVLDAGADLIEAASVTGAALIRDARDGRIDEPEAHRARLARVEKAAADIRAAIAPGIEAHRAKTAGGVR